MVSVDRVNDYNLFQSSYQHLIIVFRQTSETLVLLGCFQIKTGKMKTVNPHLNY